jgi:uncharacterized membrane protein
MFLCLAAALAAAVFFSRIMSAFTVKGARTMEEIKGLEMYMGAAERSRLAMLVKPNETPQLFESLLPYAYALGCSKTWADSFAETLKKASYAPEWDNTGNWRQRQWTFSRRLSRDLSGSITSSIGSYYAKQAKATSSSGSFRGGSGFGGGGRVGGGGGGGGGRGW